MYTAGRPFSVRTRILRPSSSRGLGIDIRVGPHARLRTGQIVEARYPFIEKIVQGVDMGQRYESGNLGPWKPSTVSCS